MLSLEEGRQHGQVHKGNLWKNGGNLASNTPTPPNSWHGEQGSTHVPTDVLWSFAKEPHPADLHLLPSGSTMGSACRAALEHKGWFGHPLSTQPSSWVKPGLPSPFRSLCLILAPVLQVHSTERGSGSPGHVLPSTVDNFACRNNMTK